MLELLRMRQGELQELMDDPNCDKDRLMHTYRAFEIINITSCWRRIYRIFIRPRLNRQKEPKSLLDIGFGGGDIPIKIRQWAMAEGFDLQVTAIDSNPQALAFVQAERKESGVTFLTATAEDMLRAGSHFDFVISNNMVHHLKEKELFALLDCASNLSRDMVIFNDIERVLLAYLATSLFPPWFYQGSYIHHDGPVSVRRSYRADELRAVIPKTWQVKRLFPARLLLLHQH